jgi:hypothetical protein
LENELKLLRFPLGVKTTELADYKLLHAGNFVVEKSFFAVSDIEFIEHWSVSFPKAVHEALLNGCAAR